MDQGLFLAHFFRRKEKNKVLHELSGEYEILGTCWFYSTFCYWEKRNKFSGNKHDNGLKTRETFSFVQKSRQIQFAVTFGRSEAIVGRSAVSRN